MIGVERRDGVLLVTIDRQERRNAVNHEALQGLLDAVHQAADARAVVLTGAGDRAFCAGGDIRSLYESGKEGTPYARAFYRDEYRLDATIKHYSKPYIALIHGIVMGGGVGVSLHGAFRVADETTTFAMPETGIGLFPDVGGSYFLPRCPGEIGMYLALTGTRLRSADTLLAGVATHLVSSEHHEGVLTQLASSSHPREVLAKFATEPSGSATLLNERGQIDRCFSKESVEAILGALASEGTDWARRTAAVIKAKSPTSTKLAFEQVRRGRTLEFDDCMRMEFRMVNRVIDGHDFYEGVRATIIDKDNQPKWRPKSLSEVSDAEIAKYFAPLESELDLSGT